MQGESPESYAGSRREPTGEFDLIRNAFQEVVGADQTAKHVQDLRIVMKTLGASLSNVQTQKMFDYIQGNLTIVHASHFFSCIQNYMDNDISVMGAKASVVYAIKGFARSLEGINSAASTPISGTRSSSQTEPFSLPELPKQRTFRIHRRYTSVLEDDAEAIQKLKQNPRSVCLFLERGSISHLNGKYRFSRYSPNGEPKFVNTKDRKLFIMRRGDIWTIGTNKIDYYIAEHDGNLPPHNQWEPTEHGKFPAPGVRYHFIAAKAANQLQTYSVLFDQAPDITFDIVGDGTELVIKGWHNAEYNDQLAKGDILISINWKAFNSAKKAILALEEVSLPFQAVFGRHEAYGEEDSLSSGEEDGPAEDEEESSEDSSTSDDEQENEYDFWGDFQNEVSVRDLFRWMSDNGVHMTKKQDAAQLVAQLRGVPKSEVNQEEDPGVAHLFAKTFSEIRKLMRHLPATVMDDLLRGDSEEDNDEHLHLQAWSVISVKGEDIAKCCENFRKEEHKIAETLCHCLGQTCVSCWVDEDEKGIEIALKPGVSHRYLRKANQILKELKFSMYFRAVFRKDRNHWERGTLVKIRDPMDDHDYQGKIEKSACTNWVEVHWRNDEGEKCQCRLSRHHRHLYNLELTTVPECERPKESVTHNDLTEERKQHMFQEFKKFRNYMHNVFERMEKMKGYRRESQIAKEPPIQLINEAAKLVNQKTDRRFKVPSVLQGLGEEASVSEEDLSDAEGSPGATVNIPNLDLPEESSVPRVHDKVMFKRKKKGNTYEGTVIEVRESEAVDGVQLKVKFIKKRKVQSQWIDMSQLINTERSSRKGLKKRDSFFHQIREKNEANCVIS